MLNPRSGCTIKEPEYEPSLFYFHVPRFIAIAEPTPPNVSPLESLNTAGMKPKPTIPFIKMEIGNKEIIGNNGPLMQIIPY